MTPEHKQIVQNSWEQIAPISDTAAELFYGRLFELDPMLRQLFASTNMEAQGKKLMEMLAMAVKGLDNLDQLVIDEISVGCFLFSFTYSVHDGSYTGIYAQR